MPCELSEAAQTDFPDGDRPAKKMRVDDPPRSPGASSDVIDDDDDIYGESKDSVQHPSALREPAAALPAKSPSQSTLQSPSTLPGLGTTNAQEVTTEVVSGTSATAPPQETADRKDSIEAVATHADVSAIAQEPQLETLVKDVELVPGIASEPTDLATSKTTLPAEPGDATLKSGVPSATGQEILEQQETGAPPLQEDPMETETAQQVLSGKDQHVQVSEAAKTVEAEDQPMAVVNEAEVVVGESPTVLTNGETHNAAPVSTADGSHPHLASSTDSTLPVKAIGGKDNHEAEFQFDSSDAESSDSSDASDSDSSESADGESDEDDYPLLGPEEQARMLMAEGGGSDDEGPQRRSGAKSGPKTANEQKEVKVEKPDITVTPEMEIVELGSAQNIVENYLLVRGTTSGETQVLESGSVLCLPDRTVIGAVAEPLGRVETPMYSVAFTNAEDIAASGITIGCKIFYVKQHSSYVFTQPLKNMKYTDASNLHDEDVDDDEMEFSDDEAEAAYKRAKKQEKLAKKGIVQGTGGKKSGPPTHPGSASSAYPDVPIKYDDEDADSLYNPLSRPGQNELPPKPSGAFGQTPRRGDYGRGRGDRGRGDRGRGQRGRDRDRGRGGRGGSQSTRPALPPQEAVAPPQAYGGQAEYQRSPYGAPSYPQPSNYWNQASSAAAPAPPNTGFNPPPGSFVNPAFFQRQQQQNAPFPPAQQYGAQEQSHYGVPPSYNPQQNFQYPQGQYPGGGFGYNQSRQWNG